MHILAITLLIMIALTSPKLLKSFTIQRIHRHSISSQLQSTFTPRDQDYLQQALDCAKHGKTHTFPNPAVGCVIVNDDDNIVLGQGFHPRAGFPHAEVFALLEATQHIASGMQEAQSVVDGQPSSSIQDLTERYRAPGGAKQLLSSAQQQLQGATAYVTLEPCCHHGRTPPCAESLVLAGVKRVVVGVRDPNPVVDGGGVAVLEAANVTTVIAPRGLEVQSDCAQLIENFGKRITMPPLESLSGKEKRKLRALAGQKQREKSLVSVEWGGAALDLDKDSTTPEEAVQQIEIAPHWVENLDAMLWQHELLQVKLNRAVGKRKHAEALGERIAESLQAHVAQSKGHGVLLYRPGMPQKIKLESDEETQAA